MSAKGDASSRAGFARVGGPGGAMQQSVTLQGVKAFRVPVPERVRENDLCRTIGQPESCPIFLLSGYWPLLSGLSDYRSAYGDFCGNGVRGVLIDARIAHALSNFSQVVSQ
jgi:hypothetical protein